MGAGFGSGAAFIEERYGCRVIPLERSPTARCLGMLIHGKRIRRAAGLELPLPPASVDAVIAVDAMTDLSIETFFKAARRVLKPCGRLVVADVRRQPSEDTRAVFNAAFRKAGFMEHRVEDVTPTALQACEEDGARRRRALRYLPRKLRESFGDTLCLPESDGYRAFADDERAYVFAYGTAPA